MSLLWSQYIVVEVRLLGIVNVYCFGDYFYSVFKVVKGVCKEQFIFDNFIEVFVDRVVRSFFVLGYVGLDLVVVQKVLEQFVFKLVVLVRMENQVKVKFIIQWSFLCSYCYFQSFQCSLCVYVLCYGKFYDEMGVFVNDKGGVVMFFVFFELYICYV